MNFILILCYFQHGDYSSVSAVHEASVTRHVKKLFS